MEQELQRNKIKICIIGTGNWGSKVINTTSLIERYDLIGTINSKTEDAQKYELLSNSDLLYIALHPEHQLEYILYAIENDKHVICETPFLTSLADRKMIYQKLSDKKFEKIFHINFPYIQDMDFVRYVRESLSNNAKFVSIKVSGPDTLNSDEKKLKKLYSNQSINAVHFFHFMMGKDKFENFNIKDNYSGFISGQGCIYDFSWGISDYPKLDIEFKTSEIAHKKTIVYDQYDQIAPLLISTSNKIYNIYPSNFKIVTSNPDFWEKMNLTLYLYACTSEYFSDIFSETVEFPKIIDDPLKLYFNGGLN